MKKNQLFSVLTLMFLVLFGTTSCIKDEAANAEADILSVSVDNDVLLRNPIVSNDEVKLFTADSTDLSKVKIHFTLTQGATITSGDTTNTDYTNARLFTITSQDGNWSKTYKVHFVRIDGITDFHLDDMHYYTYTDQWDPSAAPVNKFHILSETTLSKKQINWASGNPGFLITAGNSPAEDYPTFQSNDGFKGKCAQLVTRSTGFLGRMFGAPIAAGNLFLGDFQLDISNALRSTHFGIPYLQEPVALSGYYKYQAGASFTDKNSKVIADKKDIFTIYAVLYEVTTEVPYLDGTNSLTSENIVKIAKLEDKKETNEWTRFEVPFTFLEGKSIDIEKLQAGKYNLAIVLSSSEDGANFNGAVGSTLWVDELHIDVKY